MNRRDFLSHTTTAVGASLATAALSTPAPLPAATTAVSGAPPPNLADFLSISDFETAARKVLPSAVYEYYSGAAADEITLRWNHEKYNDLRLHPYVLNDVSNVDCSLELFGRRMPMPLLLAPASNHRLAHPEGELATVRGANETGVTMILSSGANTSIEDVVKAATGPVFFQLYMPKDRGFARGLVQRVEQAGAQAICLTVDNPVTGSRNREQRAKLVYPPDLPFPHYVGMGDPSSSVTLDNIRPAKLVWDDVAWLRSITKLPIFLKGITRASDAERAIAAGAAAIIVSNHGARELDTQPATIEVLPSITAQVAGRVPVLVDGGIRRGTDIVKALAVGANAVMIGRPYLYGLAVGGSAGVTHVVKLLRQELLLAMALLGCPNIAAINRSILWDGASESRPKS